MKDKNAFCITGWHFPLDYYQAVSQLSGVDIYILSHKKRRDIPSFLFDLFPPEQILIQSNIGYDWGCYQQFLSAGFWQRYPRLFFMHDDLEILDFGFIEKVTELLDRYAVIGNGKGQGSVSSSSVRGHPYAYAHSSWKPESFDFQHPTVRGSFFATTREILQQIGSFEVYWDPFKINIGFGNWSTKASCGKIAAAFGSNCFGYLSDTFGKSSYMIELIRGEEGGELGHLDNMHQFLYGFLKRLSRVYMELLYKKREIRAQALWARGLQPILKLFSSKLY